MESVTTLYTLTESQLEAIADLVVSKMIARQTNSELKSATCNKVEAARFLGVTRLTIYNMVDDGRIKATADGRRIVTQSLVDYRDGVQSGRIKTSNRGKKKYV